MEILRIGKHAVKVSLTIEEASEYKAASYGELDNQEIKEAFSKLLLKVKERVDFSYAGKNIFTEIYPKNDGGCEIFISCIGTEANKAVYKDKNQPTEQKKTKLSSSIYSFDDLKNLLFVCYRLNEIQYNGKCSLYYDYDREEYVLILDDVLPKDLKYAFILEYGKYIKGNNKDFIKEHFKCVLKKDSVKILSALV